MPVELTVELAAAKERLDKFLVRHLAGTSRSQIQKLIASGSVRVNGAATTAHRSLKPNDIVTIAEEVQKNPAPVQAHRPIPDILYEDQNFLVINKPAGLTVHPGIGTKEPTLIDWLTAHVPSITTVGDEPDIRPGIVHRLDRDVSGVMVIAKTQQAFDHLKQQFQDRTIHKEYLALVHGLPEKSEDTIRFKIERSKHMRGRMRALPLLPDEGMADAKPRGSHAAIRGGQGRRVEGGREAITHYVVEKKVKNNALLRLTIETGRTHQIRVHLKAIGHPIVGDTVYQTKGFRHKSEPINRPFLHATKLSFANVDGSMMTFEEPLPEELRKFIST